MENNTSIASIARSFYEQMRLCTNAGCTQRFRKNEPIFERGIRSDGIYYLTSGKVKISSNMADGTVRVFAILAGPNLFGETETFDQGPRMVSATALNTVEVIYWDQATLVDVIRLHPELSLLIIQTLGIKLRWLTFRTEDLTSPRTLGYRLASVLVDHDKYCLFSEGSGKRLSITHSELADAIGSTRSKVTHQLASFADAGFIRTLRGAIEIIDIEGLEAYLKKLEEEGQKCFLPSKISSKPQC